MSCRRLRQLAVFLLLWTVACGLGDGPDGGEQPTRDYTVRLSYVSWSTEVASTNLVKAVLQERLGYPCEIVAMSADEMWASVAAGDVDAMVSAWLPSTHEHFWRRYRDQVVDLGPNLTGTRIGLVVPDVNVGRQTDPTGKKNRSYITVTSIEELPGVAGRFGNAIVGIDPEAGVMHKTREAMEAYGLEEGYQLVEGSEASMTEQLTEAIQGQQWIVVTGWKPHWMFGRWELRFLEDPEGVYGGREAIHTLVRPGLEEDAPDAYRFLDRFQWTTEEMDALMALIQREKGLYPYRHALRWVDTHPDRVASWLPESS